MSFLIYDLTFLILFTLGVIIFLYKKRRNLKKEGIMYLYRTQLGIKFISYIGGKYKKTLKFLGYLAVVSGYVLMIGMLYLFGQIAYIYLKSPDVARAIKVPPIMPLIPYIDSIPGLGFLPPFYFTYFIISIAVISIFHEFSHGIFMKLNKIRIKTTGFGGIWLISEFFTGLRNGISKKFKLNKLKSLWITLILTVIALLIIVVGSFYSTILFIVLILLLVPFLGAFVEQDDKQMKKKGKFAQITVLSAGTFANLMLAILFFLLLSVFFVLTYAPAGAIFNTYTPGIVNITDIQKIDGVTVINSSNETILNIINENNLTNGLVLGVNGNQINLTRVVANNNSYFITINNLKEQLVAGGAQVALYEDLPAINVGLTGVIIEVDSNKIKTHDDLARVLDNYKVGDKINIKTKENNTILNYDIVLREDPNEKGRAVIGIGVLKQNTKLIGRISEFFNFFKEPATYYEPRFSTDLVIFIYYLIWWLALLNLTVALTNMLPVNPFDGGRTFMLTIAGITGSEKVGKLVLKIMAWIILGIFLLLMLGWFLAVF